MDSAGYFRQGFLSGLPLPGMVLPPQQFFQPQAPPPMHPGLMRRRESESEAPSRVAHTLTACCRCRQRKTRCDPALPRCLPCERSDSVCEYYDSTKGRKISRFYVVKLQQKVRQLEADLAQFTEEDLPEDTEAMLRPGGLVRLGDSDETPRYLGPSSGIAMTRLLMEEAKRYTASQSISELIPELHARRIERLNRMQSLNAGRRNTSFSSSTLHKKSYPMISAHPAEALPSRYIVDRLVEVFNTRAQVFTPILHERVLATQVNEVCGGDTDPHKNFIVRMVMAISLQKLDTQYAGLADSYHLSAMERFEDVIRTKDMRTLQCLALIEQYSLLTPTRTNVYHIVGLATRLCQQLAIVDEKTITGGFQIDALALDMRRRLVWVITGMELGLAYTMGRPNGLSKGDDLLDVGFFADVDDSCITEDGIQAGPPSERKQVAIHFCKMRLCQAEIRRVLYEKKRLEPRSEDHPWFAQMEKNIQDWLDSSPDQPTWCKPWFTGCYHTMIITLYRPSPQVPKPSACATMRCYKSAAYVTNLCSQQVKNRAIDITWVFLLTVYMALNTILWSVSYPEVRQEHPREEIEELVNTGLDIIDRSSERWPGASTASQLYAIFSKACLQSYDTKEEDSRQQPLSLPPVPLFNPAQYGVPDSASSQHAPTSQIDPNSSPPTSGTNLLHAPNASQQGQQAPPVFNTPQFNPQFSYGFNTTESALPPSTYDFDDPTHMRGQPQFRSGSIFLNPPSNEPLGRRFSYFPPDAPAAPASSMGDLSVKDEDGSVPPTLSTYTSSLLSMSPSLATSPDAYTTPTGSSSTLSGTEMTPTTITSPNSTTPTPTVRHVSPLQPSAEQASGNADDQKHQNPGPPASSLASRIKFEPPQTPQTLRLQQQQLQQQQQQAMPPMTRPPLVVNKNRSSQKRLQQAQPPRPQPTPQQPLPPPLQRPPPPPPPPQQQQQQQQPQHDEQQNQHQQYDQRQQHPQTTVSDWFAPSPAPFVFSNLGNGGGGGGGSGSTAYNMPGPSAFSGYGLGGFGDMTNPLGPLGPLGGLNAMVSLSPMPHLNSSGGGGGGVGNNAIDAMDPLHTAMHNMHNLHGLSENNGHQYTTGMGHSGGGGGGGAAGGGGGGGGGNDGGDSYGFTSNMHGLGMNSMSGSLGGGMGSGSMNGLHSMQGLPGIHGALNGSGGGGGGGMNGTHYDMGMSLGLGLGLDGDASQRQGSLSQEQQMELMDVLETEGIGEIDSFLTMGGSADSTGVGDGGGSNGGGDGDGGNSNGPRETVHWQ